MEGNSPSDDRASSDGELDALPDAEGPRGERRPRGGIAAATWTDARAGEDGGDPEEEGRRRGRGEEMSNTHGYAWTEVRGA